MSDCPGAVVPVSVNSGFVSVICVKDVEEIPVMEQNVLVLPA